MSNGPFIWHPDQDDTYNGDVYGNTTLTGSFSSFDKISGNNFTMIGNDDAILKLSPVGGGRSETLWGVWSENDSHLTQFNIKGGTFIFQTNPVDPSRPARRPRQTATQGQLMLGDSGPDLRTLEINVESSFIMQHVSVFADPGSDEIPLITFNVDLGGTCRITGAEEFSGTFKTNVHDLSSMSVAAAYVGLFYGKCVIDGAPPDGNSASSSLEIVASPSASSVRPPPYSVAGPGDLVLLSHEISCSSTSVSRLHAKRMYCNGALIYVKDAASLVIACDTIELDTPILYKVTGTVFSVGKGTASITFTGVGRDSAPFVFLDKPAPFYPKGLFNFITNESTEKNQSKFRFRGAGSAFDHARLVQEGTITINGQPVTPGQTDWANEVENGNLAESYFTIFLKNP